MPCYHPTWVRLPLTKEKEKHPGLYFLGKLGSGPGPGPVIDSNTGETVEPFLLPCGSCIGCRLDYSRRWADRLCFEDRSQDLPSWFITLTYNDDHLPIGSKGFPTLDKRAVQRFIKRLRARLPECAIRYYLAGEYGSRTARPHYHAILFGTNFPADDFSVYKGTPEGVIYTSKLLSEVWPYGFNTVAEFSWRTAAYVARYVTKKTKGKEAAQVYDAYGIESEFSLMSRRPGLGLQYFIEHGSTEQFEREQDQSRESDLQNGVAWSSDLWLHGRCLAWPREFRRHKLFGDLGRADLAARHGCRIGNLRRDSQDAVTATTSLDRLLAEERAKKRASQILNSSL